MYVIKLDIMYKKEFFKYVVYILYYYILYIFYILYVYKLNNIT